MSLYGTPQIALDNDITDRIGIRTLALSLMWQPSREGLSQIEVDAEKPAAPGVPGGLLIIGEQTRRGGGVYKTSWTFEGINGDGKSVTFKDRGHSMDYGFDPSFSQLPIELFPDFQNLMMNYGGSFSADEDKVIWAEKLTNANSAASGGLPGGSAGSAAAKYNPMFGRQDFFTITGHYRYRYASLRAPSQKGAGKIATKIPGGPPEIEGDRNWLYAAAPYKRRGLIYDITEIYWLSEEGGWPEPVYKSTKGVSGSVDGLSGGGLSGGSLSGVLDNNAAYLSAANNAANAAPITGPGVDTGTPGSLNYSYYV